jgi:hypothetical protein
MKGQMNFVFMAIGVLVAIIALVLAQTFVTNSIGNFTAGTIERTVVAYIVPLMAVGLLVVVAYGAIGGKR